ncbi:MAG: ThiF family adenylyltransferase [bacterium]
MKKERTNVQPINKYLNRLEGLINNETLETLRDKKVLIVGCGGVGSNIVNRLVQHGALFPYKSDGVASSGIIEVWDGDKVGPEDYPKMAGMKAKYLPDLTNGKEGGFKVDMVHEMVEDMTPPEYRSSLKEKFITHNEFLTGDKLQEVIKEGSWDYIIECGDQMPDKLTVHKLAKEVKTKVLMTTDIHHKVSLSFFDYSDPRTELYGGNIDPTAANELLELTKTTNESESNIERIKKLSGKILFGFVPIFTIPSRMLRAYAYHIRKNPERPTLPQTPTATTTAGSMAVTAIIMDIERGKVPNKSYVDFDWSKFNLIERIKEIAIDRPRAIISLMKLMAEIKKDK